MRELIMKKCEYMICDMNTEDLTKLHKIIEDRLRWINGDEPNEN
jgi:hypothetical protein